MNYKDYNDEELLMYIRESSEDAHEILFKKYKPLVSSIVKKFYPYVSSSGLEKSDLMQEGYLGLNAAIERYSDEKENVFYTFARKCIERRVISAVVTANRQKHKILNESLSLEYNDLEKEIYSIEDFLYDKEEDPLEKIVLLENKEELLSSLNKILTENEKKVLELKNFGHNYQEIAQILGKSHKAIDNTIQRIRIKVNNHILKIKPKS